jgi:hypothetical protein
MNLNRVFEKVVPFVLVVAAVAAVSIVMLALAGWAFPALSQQTGLGLGTIGLSLQNQFGVVTALTGLSPLADLILGVAAYVLVCILLWLQAEIRTYLANQSHFKS